MSEYVGKITSLVGTGQVFTEEFTTFVISGIELMIFVLWMM